MNEQSPPKKLTRSRSDRYIGGVAAGLSDRFNVDPIFVRIAFVASLFFGGLGLLAYVVLLAVMPLEGDASEPLPPLEPKRRNMMIGLAVIVGAICIATADSGTMVAWIFGFWPGTVFGVLFWVGAAVAVIWLLATGAFTRRNGDAGPPSSPSSQSPPSSPSAEPPAVADPAPTEPGPEPSAEAEPVTYAESPTQLSRTEVMETRSMEAGPADAQGDAYAQSEAAQPAFRDGGPSVVGKIMVWFALGLAGLIVFACLFVVSAGATVMLGGVPMAALVIILGAAMVFAGLRGRRQLSLWLLTAAVAVTIPMAAVSIADLRVEGSYGDLNETPLSVVDIPDDGYKMAAGNMTIDLRKFKFDQRRELELPVKSGMGLTSIVVPDGICVAGTVTGKAGIANIRGHESNGIDVRVAAPGPPGWKPGMGSRGRLVYLDADFKLGAFEVVDNTQWRRNGQGGSFDENDSRSGDGSSSSARERGAAACSAKAPRTADDKARAKVRS